MGSSGKRGSVMFCQSLSESLSLPVSQVERGVLLILELRSGLFNSLLTDDGKALGDGLSDEL